MPKKSAPTLFDRILKHGAVRIGEELRGVRYHKVPSEAVSVMADNVSGYWARELDGWIENPTQQMPNISPPWDNFFIEYKAYIHLLQPCNPMRSFFESLDLHPNRFGVYFENLPLEETTQGMMEFQSQLPIEQNPKWELAQVAFWLQMEVYAGYGGDFIKGPMGSLLAPVTKEGRVLNDHAGERRMLCLPGDSDQDLTDSSIEDVQAMQELVQWAASPALLAISFLHCKNVRVKQVNPPQPKQSRIDGSLAVPRNSYHVLDIEPMKRVLETEGDLKKEGLSRALHICRGHFRTYEERGPGGRLLDDPLTVWVSPHTRGSLSAGQTVKAYNVKTPKKGNDE